MNTNANSVAEFFRANSLGLEKGLGAVLNSLGGAGGKFPFFDLYKSKTGDQYRVDVAVAGFTEKELEVTLDNGVLAVEATKSVEDLPENLFSAYFKSIAERSFRKTFLIGNEFEVESVTLKYGILSIYLKETVSKNVKKLPITVA